jgi:hypothetical protein
VNYSTTYSSNSSKKQDVFNFNNSDNTNNINNFTNNNNNNNHNFTPSTAKLTHNRVPSDLSINNIEHSSSFFSTSSIESLVSEDTTGGLGGTSESGGKHRKHQYRNSKNISCLNFVEDTPLHMRANLITKTAEIFKHNPEFENLNLSDISENSYFSILWTPTKSTGKFINQTSFLVFYRFKSTRILSNNIKYLQIVGLIPNKLDEEFWLSNVNNNVVTNENLFNKSIDDFFKNKYKFLQYNVSILFFIYLGMLS